MPMYSVIAIADEILKIAKAKGWSLTPLQLMKLAYISYGWALAFKGQKLFNNRIEAWKYGPVIPDLYHATKSYGRAEIPFNRISEGPSSVDPETRAFLEDVVGKYGPMSGYTLSQLTHQNGTPWQQVYQDGVLGIQIPDNLIQTHYRDLLDANR